MSDSISYLHINHSNKISLLTNEDQITLTLNVFTAIAAIQDDTIGKEINKYFNRLIPNNNDDLLQIIIKQTKLYSDKYKHPKEYIEKVINRVLNTDFNTTFTFDKFTTEDIVIILCVIYSTFANKSKNKQFGIKTYMDILKKAKNIVDNKFDAIKLFMNKGEDFNRKRESFISMSSSPLSIRKTSTFCSTASKTVMNFDFIDEAGPFSSFHYPILNKDTSKLDIGLPIEMIILINKFEIVKKIKLINDDISEKKKMECLLILLNIEWLFPMLLEVEMDLESEELANDLDEILKLKLSKAERSRAKTTMYDISRRHSWGPKVDIDDTIFIEEERMSIRRISEISRVPSTMSYASPGKGSVVNGGGGGGGKKEASLSSYVFHNTHPFENIIIISYFLSQIKNLKVLSLTFNDAFSIEVETAMRKYEVNIVNFHFLNFLASFDKLYELNVRFNSLDFTTFEKLMAMINQNSDLQNLRVSFFSPEENYSPSGLYKLFSCIGYNKPQMSLQKTTKNESDFTNSEIDHLIVSKLLNTFEENVGKLFFILQNKTKLLEFVVVFDLPCIIANNELYCLVLMKFVLNILIYLSYEKHNLHVVKLIAPYLKFDSRKDIFIDEIIEDISLQENKSIKYFDLQLQMFKIVNIDNLLSTNFISLFLGDLDADTFANFVDGFTSEDFTLRSQMRSIKIGLNLTVVLYDSIYEYVNRYISHKLKYLDEMHLLSSMRIKRKELFAEFLNCVYYKNKIDSLIIEISRVNDDEIDKEIFEMKSRINRTLISLSSIFYIKTKRTFQKKIMQRIYSQIKIPSNKIIKFRDTI